VTTKAEMLEAAAMLRRSAGRHRGGELEADTPRDRGLVRHLEGAAVALEEASRPGR